MSVKLADTLAPMGDFAIGESKDIDIEINGTNKRLQQAYEDGDLGGGSSIQVDTMPIASEHPNEIVQYVGASGTYQNGFFYQSTSDEQDPPTYSWVQKNVQPSNATATDVSYDNTTSELVATNVQDAIDEIKGGLGTASGKNFTDLVRPNSHELVESGSVYSAINNALSSIYTPRGELTCAELTSSLLIEDNVGNIYTMSDSGTTSALFINGAGQTINVKDNVGIIKAGANTYLFNLMGDAFDLHDYQKKELSSGAMIEDVIPSNASVSNKLISKSDSDALFNAKYYSASQAPDCDGITENYVLVNAGNSYVENHYPVQDLFFVKTIYSSDDDAFQTAIAYGAIDPTQKGIMYSRVKTSGTWSSWQKLATTDDILDNNHNGGFMAETVVWFKTGNLFAYPNAGGFYSSTFLMSDRDGAWTGILKLADDGAGSVTATIVSLGGSPRGGEEFYYDETSYCLYFCGTWDRITITQLTGKKADLSIVSTTQEEAKQNTKIVPINVATTTLPTLNGTCKGLADSECYATFDVTFDSWGGSSPAVIGIAVDGAYVNSKALIMVNNSIETASDKKVRILYADGVNCLFRVFASAPSLYSNTIKVYVSFYTVGTDDYSFKVQQRDYIGAISNLNVTNDSSGMPVSSWFQAIAQPSAPVLTTDVTSTVTQGSTAPVTSGGVYDVLKNTFALTRVNEHTCTLDLSLLPYAENGLCLISLMGDSNLEGSAVCSIGYFNNEWRINSVTTLVDAGNVGTITASISSSTLTVSNTGVNYSGRLSIRVGLGNYFNP